MREEFVENFLNFSICKMLLMAVVYMQTTITHFGTSQPLLRMTSMWHHKGEGQFAKDDVSNRC